jgi:hypothetical protein
MCQSVRVDRLSSQKIVDLFATSVMADLVNPFDQMNVVSNYGNYKMDTVNISLHLGSLRSL